MPTYSPDENLLSSENADLKTSKSEKEDAFRNDLDAVYAPGLQNAFIDPYAIKADLKNPVCTVIKSLDSNSPPIVGTYVWTKRTSQNLNTEKPILQGYVVSTNAHSQVLPYPTNIVSPNPGDAFLNTLHTYVFSDDEEIINKGIRPTDKVQIEYIGNDQSEARIIKVISSENKNVPISSPKTAKEAHNDSNGTTLADRKNSTTGDITQDLSNNAISGSTISDEIGLCGNGTSKYPAVKCKTAKFDASSQTATLHPVFWDQINNLLNKIKSQENYIIKHGETIRTPKGQYTARIKRCPAALTEKDGFNTIGFGKKEKKEPGKVGGEAWLKKARWSDVISNFKCNDTTPTAALEGIWASNHIVGLAIDFKMDIQPCPSNEKPEKVPGYNKCRATSKVFFLINKYAKEFGVINLVSEPWHWSHNGG
jgi:hypothetical protein